MNNKDIEKRIEDLERALRSVEGVCYQLVSMTVGFQAKKPPEALYRQWLEECGVNVEMVISAVNRFSSVIPFANFGGDDLPPDEWVLVKGLQTVSGHPEELRPKWWVHPILSQRYREWLLA